MARRARHPESVRLVEAHDPLDGATVWIALSRSHPQRAWLLRPGPDGRPLCGCPRFAYYADCPHVAAYHALVAQTILTIGDS
jgi:hypothetical protein